MIISLDWIKDFVEISDDVKIGELESLFTLGVAEIEKVISMGDYWDAIKIAEILEIEKHPEADKLNLVTFTIGENKNLRVVCGASNVKVGLKTLFAPIGVTLPIGFTLEPKKIRGVLSEGMLCSEEELGLSDESSGIIELPENSQVGMTALEYLKESKDILFDIDNKSLTHRPDLWGHFGMAREFALLLNSPLKNRFDENWKNQIKEKLNNNKTSPLSIEVSNDSSCLGYFGVSLENVEVKESPIWLKRRIEAVGLRPINNIVDISNYVMLELGHPLHIFDRDKIRGDKVIIKKNAEAGATFITLDEKERVLTTNDTMIFDQDNPLVLAGVMGGLDSGVTELTKNIFIEVANWKSDEVRKTSTRLGLRTDSSQRYEKTLDSMMMERTLLRTVELVMELSSQASAVGLIEYDGPKLEETNFKINISLEKINKTLGLDLSLEKVLGIFKGLEFKVSEENGELTVDIPSFRATKDIECDADLIEEIGRIIGYDHIVPVGPALSIQPVELQNHLKLQREISDFLTHHGSCFEVMTYPMVGKKLLEKCDLLTGDELALVNSLSVDHSLMRKTLLPSLLEASALNSKNFNDFKLFELGRSYSPGEKSFVNENGQLGVVFYSKNENCFLDLVNNINRLLNYLSVPAVLELKNDRFKNNLIDQEWSGFHPHEFYNVKIMGKMEGVISTLHPLVAKSLKIKGNLSFALIDLGKLKNLQRSKKVKYKPLPKFPSADFDYTITVHEETSVADVLNCLKKVKIKEVVDHKVVDIFKEDKTQKHITLRTRFLDEKATLSGDFLKSAEATIINQLEKSGFNLKQA